MSGERTIGNYVLGPLLGRGGMSEVHAGAHRFLGDRVAIKLLRSQLAADAAATAAFVAEATRTRAIDHPGVVRVLDFGSDGDAFYLVMERLDGESLAARLARAGRLDEPELRRLGAAIADGLAAAHDRGIVHRDLKPGNIVLVGDQPKIIDFGIAREVAAAATGSRLGTIAYMAPEQLTGGLVAPCVDIWALGVVLYEAAAGRLPFDGFAGGRTPQLFEAPPPLGGVAPVSPALASLIAGCLERDLTRRTPSMRAIAEALRDPGEDPRITQDVAPAAGRDGAGGAGASGDRPTAGTGADRSIAADRRWRRRIVGRWDRSRRSRSRPPGRSASCACAAPRIARLRRARPAPAVPWRPRPRPRRHPRPRRRQHPAIRRRPHRLRRYPLLLPHHPAIRRRRLQWRRCHRALRRRTRLRSRRRTRPRSRRASRSRSAARRPAPRSSSAASASASPPRRSRSTGRRRSS